MSTQQTPFSYFENNLSVPNIWSSKCDANQKWVGNSILKLIKYNNNNSDRFIYKSNEMVKSMTPEWCMVYRDYDHNLIVLIL